MRHSRPSARFRGAPTLRVGPALEGTGAIDVPVAVGWRVRLLGLSHLDRADAVSGLLIPRCAAVHTFGMRFHLDIVFLDARLRPLATRLAVPPRRMAAHRAAAAVLELPSRPADSGKFGAGGGEPGRPVHG
jgi:uncharacterized protein